VAKLLKFAFSNYKYFAVTFEYEMEKHRPPFVAPLAEGVLLVCRMLLLPHLHFPLSKLRAPSPLVFATSEGFRPSAPRQLHKAKCLRFEVSASAVNNAQLLLLVVVTERCCYCGTE